MKPWTDADVRAAVWLGGFLGMIGTLVLQQAFRLLFIGIDKLAARVKRRLERASTRGDKP